MSALADLASFYELLDELERRCGGRRRLGACTSRDAWPARGVYFMFEPGEARPGGARPRVVRVGTHAVSAGSRSKLWQRLSQHKGTGTDGAGGGNHRGSILRKHVGEALIARGGVTPVASWGEGSSAPADIRAGERVLEKEVSAFIARMDVLWLAIDDPPSAASLRATVERNGIALLSGAEAPSVGWLGRFARDERIRRTGLWNVNHVNERYDPSFLPMMQRLIRARPEEP